MKMTKLGKNKRSSSSPTFSTGQELGKSKGARKHSTPARKKSIIEVGYAPVSKKGVRNYVYVNPKGFDLESLMKDPEKSPGLMNAIRKIQEKAGLLGGKGKRSKGIRLFDNVKVIEDYKAATVEPTVV